MMCINLQRTAYLMNLSADLSLSEYLSILTPKPDDVHV